MFNSIFARFSRMMRRNNNQGQGQTSGTTPQHFDNFQDQLKSIKDLQREDSPGRKGTAG
jgi:hypothetical protein